VGSISRYEFPRNMKNCSLPKAKFSAKVYVFVYKHLFSCGQDSAVGIAIRYRLEGGARGSAVG